MARILNYVCVGICVPLPFGLPWIDVFYVAGYTYALRKLCGRPYILVESLVSMYNSNCTFERCND